MDEEGYPIAGPSNQYSIDALFISAKASNPRLVNLPISPITGRPNRPDFEALLGPDPIFSTVETFAGTYVVGCRPRYGYEGEGLWNEDEAEEHEFNECIMHMTQRRGGWRRWPKANILVLKAIPESGETGSSPQYTDASMFDVPPLARYFELLGTVPGMSWYSAFALHRNPHCVLVESELKAMMLSV